jgi:hypothetical protein
MELFVIFIVFVLNFPEVWIYIDSGTPTTDELSGHYCFWFTYVWSTEKELTVQVRDVYRIHVNYIDITETSQGKRFQKLTAEAASTDDKDFAVQEVLAAFITGSKYVLTEWASLGEKGLDAGRKHWGM